MEDLMDSTRPHVKVSEPSHTHIHVKVTFSKSEMPQTDFCRKNDTIDFSTMRNI